VAYSQDPARRAMPAARELLDLDGNGKPVDAADLELAVRRYLGETAIGAKVRVWHYYHSDHLDSPTHVTDSAGNLVSVTRFHPYGRVYERQGETPEYGFAGSQREPAAELGLIRMGARWYAPEIGRWASADKAMAADPARMVNKPLEANLFSYAANSPTSLVDRDGQEGKFGEFMSGFVNGVVDAAPKAFVTGLAIGAAVALAPAIGPALAVVGAAMAIKGAVDTYSACASGSMGQCGEAVGEQVGGAVGVAAGGALGANAARMARSMGSKLQSAPANSGGCFVAGTPVDTAEGPVEIQEVALAARAGPESKECARLDFSDWKEVDLEFRPKKSGSGEGGVSIRLLRPARWLVENSIALGATVALKLSELNTSGVATVTGIGDGPRLKPGARCPVTGLMRRLSRDVLRVLLVGGAVLEVTNQHPLFSADRNDWVRAGELLVGERLETRTGVTSVAQVEADRKGNIEVFNLEVAREHRYYVGVHGVLAHNECPGDAAESAGKLPRFQGPKPTYHVNEAHVPGPKFNPKKEPLPADAAEVYKRAVPDASEAARNWYGKNADGTIYRFSNGNDGTAHFSGSSATKDGIRNITPYARQRLEGK
jgi:RHS repeat-associated protein